MSTWQVTLDEHQRVLAQMVELRPTLDAIADALVACFQAGKRLYLIGNGGSAADAQHIAGELLGRFRRERRSLPAIALTTDTSTLTAIANDYDFERVFARQLEGLLQPGDAVWILSTSGNSPNALAAAHTAKSRDATLIGFTGATGGKLAGLCHHVVKVPHERSDRIQEGHLVAYHYLCERIEAAFPE